MKKQVVGLMTVAVLSVAAPWPMASVNAQVAARNSELSGHVFVRTGGGDTKPQGGLELRLLDPAIRTDIAQLQVQLELESAARLAAAKSIRDNIDAEQQTLTSEVARWTNEQYGLIKVAVLKKTSDHGRGLSVRGVDVSVAPGVDVSVTNGSQVPLRTASVQFSCGTTLVPNGNADSEKGDLLYLLVGATGDALNPEGSMNTTIMDHTQSSRSLRSCPLDQLSARVTKFSADFGRGDMDKFCLTAAAVSSREKIAALNKQLSTTQRAPDIDVLLAILVAKRTKHSVHADVYGRYLFKNLAPGPYVVFAIYKTAFDDTAWLVDVRVSGKTTMDLSNYNFSDPRPKLGGIGDHQLSTSHEQFSRRSPS